MKIYCNTEELQAAVNIASKAVSSKSSIPYLEGVLLEAECDRLYLTGNDLEIYIKTSIPCNISEEGNLKGDELTNYPEIFNSPDDMLGIQKLIDKYIEEKPYMNVE